MGCEYCFLLCYWICWLLICFCYAGSIVSLDAKSLVHFSTHSVKSSITNAPKNSMKNSKPPYPNLSSPHPQNPSPSHHTSSPPTPAHPDSFTPPNNSSKTHIPMLNYSIYSYSRIIRRFFKRRKRLKRLWRI